MVFTTPAIRRLMPILGVVGVVCLLYGVFIFTTPGEFTQWTKWSECSVSCGQGIIQRTRTCTAPMPWPFGLDCDGLRIEKKDCQQKPCPINGGFSQWTLFDKCDKSCGGGKKTRIRTCNNPIPKYGGQRCAHLGSPVETQSCNVQPCPVNGGYSAWGAYSDCELEGGKHCGKGKKVRVRSCNNPVPQHGGKSCEGPDKENAECEIVCPTTLLTTNTTSNVTPTTTKST